MRLSDSEANLLDRLEAAGLSPLALDPWEAWKVFKTYLHSLVDDDRSVPYVDDDLYDAASFQCDDHQVFFIRQFSRWEGSKDEGILRVVIRLTYDPAEKPLGPVELWTHDYRTLEEFASVVEGNPQFQQALNSRLSNTEVFAEEI